MERYLAFGENTHVLCLISKLCIIYMERYRSGHNGADSKSYTVVLCDYLKSGLNTDFLSSCFEQLRFFLTAFLTDLHLIFKFTLAFAM